MKNWKQWIGWTFLTLAVLGSGDKNPDASATLFLAGVVIYWGKRINESIRALKE